MAKPKSENMNGTANAVKGQKILFTVSEASPFVSTGGMGQVAGVLPEVLRRVSPGMDVRVVAPYYRQVRNRFGGSGMEFLGSFRVDLGWRNQYCGVFTVERMGVVYYFLDNEYYFDRDECYGYFDDGERFAFFSRAALAMLGFVGFVPDVIHAHDWQTALVPIYLRTSFAETHPDIRSVFTIHNIEYQGKFPEHILEDVFGISGFFRGLVEYKSCINLVKGAIICCDKLTTVSPSYAEEIKHGGGYDLEPIILENEYKLSGIINGIDTVFYDPATDTSLAKTYTSETLENKTANKLALQKLFGLPPSPRMPLICMVSRLVRHKGMDLVTAVVEDLMRDNVQIILLGTGDHEYELAFSEFAARYPDRIAVNIAFNPEIERKIYAGADIMLMPSLREPCGLAQMIACRYGTIPVVRATGGLRDTVRDCRSGEGNGFVFSEYDAGTLLYTLRQAIDLYTYWETDWRNLITEAMRGDFRWDISAKAYADLYESLR